MASQTSAPRIPTNASASYKDALAQQVYLLRNNMMGPAANYIMVITTTGRKSGVQHSTPIAYIRDGETIIALNNGGSSNWYKNVLVNPTVVLEIKGQALQARGEPVTDPGDIEQVFAVYTRARMENFERLFGVSPDALPEALAKARESQVFVRFHPVRG